MVCDESPTALDHSEVVVKGYVEWVVISCEVGCKSWSSNGSDPRAIRTVCDPRSRIENICYRMAATRFDYIGVTKNGVRCKP